jgi:hypothetical protein
MIQRFNPRTVLTLFVVFVVPLGQWLETDNAAFFHILSAHHPTIWRCITYAVNIPNHESYLRKLPSFICNPKIHGTSRAASSGKTSYIVHNEVQDKCLFHSHCQKPN